MGSDVGDTSFLPLSCLLACMRACVLEGHVVVNEPVCMQAVRHEGTLKPTAEA
jgi:hypothetical protein